MESGSSGGTARSSLRGSRPVTLIAMCLGAMITFLQITATVSALTTIQRDLRVDPTTLVWIPSAYTLMVASVVLSAATLGSRYGRKRMFGAGVEAASASEAMRIRISRCGNVAMRWSRTIFSRSRMRLW